MIHPNAVLWSCSALNNFSSSTPVKNEEIITGSIEFSQNVYLRCDGSCLSSSFGVSCMDGTSVGGLYVSY